MSLDATLQRLAGRVRLSISRVVVRAVNDALKLQGMQVELLAGEVRDGCERFQDYGFTSHPLPGAEGIGLAVGGSRDHVAVIAVGDRRFRLKNLAPGEVALYTDEGDTIVFKRGRKIHVTAATEVTLITPLTTVTGALHVMGNATFDGRVDAAGDVTGAGKSVAHHTHIGNGAGAPTSEPS